MKKYLSIILSTMLLASCVDTDIIPYGQTVEQDYWKTKSEAQQVVTKAYSGLSSADFIARLIVWGSFRSDELVLTSEVPDANRTKIALSQIETANIETTNVYNDWSSFYSVINYCNIVIDKAPDVDDPDYTEADMRLHIAQMKALRSLCYFYLVRTFRDVPYITESYRNSSQETNIPQSAPSVVLQGCIDDLTEAAEDIYDAQNFQLTDWRGRGYLNRDAVYAILADIYLWRASVLHGSNPTQAQADYQQCVDYCTRVIDAKNAFHNTTLSFGQTVDEENPYPALAATDRYFELLFTGNQNAEESIFEIQSTSNTAVMNMYYGYNGTNAAYGFMKAPGLFGTFGSSNDSYIYTNSLDTRRKYVYNWTSSDENFDVRKMITDNASTTDPTSGSQARETSISTNRNFILYRMTDVMLMKAEALVQLYDLQGGDEDVAEEPAETPAAGGEEEVEQPLSLLETAFNLVEAVNHRAIYEGSGVTYLSYANFNTVEAMNSLIMGERLREFCFEGKRYYDLLRYNYRENAKAGINTNYDAILAELDSQIPNNAVVMALMTRTLEGGSGVVAKMKTEPYLYMPILEDEMKLNTALQQNPVYSSSSQFERND